MKLVLLSANYPFGIGGDNNFIQNEINALAAKFDQVTVISTGHGAKREDVPKNVKVVRVYIDRLKLCKVMQALTFFLKKPAKKAYKELKLFYPSIKFIDAMKQLFKYEYAYYCMKNVLLKECVDADIVYSYWMSSRAYAMAKIVHKKKFDKVFISRVHGFDCYILESSKLPYRDYIIEALDKIFCASNVGKGYIENNIMPHLIAKCDLETRYLGISKECESQDLSKKKAEVLQIVTSSAIIEIKRLDLLINALSQINEINIEWTHFGDGKLMHRIEIMAKQKLEEKNNIKFTFRGFVDNKKLMEYYRNSYCDLFINCSDSEGIPVSIMEAYSFGIPVIARNVGGNSEIVQDSTGDYLISAMGSDQELKRAIVGFANKSEEEKQCKRREVSEIFKDQFSSNAIYAFAENIYELAKGGIK